MAENESNSEFAHYTDLAGLYGIASNETLWATSIRYLNDHQEVEDALGHLDTLMKKRAIDKNWLDKEGYKEFLLIVFAGLQYVSVEAASQVFVTSFSSEIDLLSQWRGYCPNNNGISIVFDLDMIVASNSDLNLELSDCIYDGGEKEDAVSNFLDTQYRRFLQNKQTKQLDLIENFAVQYMKLAARFKDSAFAEEKERRIVIHRPGVPPEFRVTDNYLVPYLELQAPVLSIRKLTIGPTGEIRLMTDGVSQFMGRQIKRAMTAADERGDTSENVGKKCAFRQSRVPFRVT